jgi:hypothetical protein
MGWLNIEMNDILFSQGQQMVAFYFGDITIW